MMKRIACGLVCLLGLGMACAEETLVPELTIARRDIPDNAALTLVADMKAGWNLGNTFDAYSDHPGFTDELQYETLWCGEKTTPELLAAVRDAGFDTIRVPVSWHDHVDGDFNISEKWLARVEEVVDAAQDAGFYVVLNTHHDVGETYYYPTKECLDTSLRYVTRVWEQLAARFASRGEKLLFEGLNEPRLKGTKYEWWLNINAQVCRDAVACINAMNQAFVDTVRAAGGENANRYLLVSGYCASLDGATNALFELPKDEADNRIIVSVHAYTPYSFALQAPTDAGSTDAFYTDKAASTGEIDTLMRRLYNTYVSKGIPVIIGEYGARQKGDNLDSRVRYAAYYTAAARASGITCCWWDNHSFRGSGENFGIIDRKTLQWAAPEIVEAIMRYAE